MEFKVYEQLWFPIPVWECPVIGINNSEIKKYCLKVRQEKPGVTISNRGGWHSNEIINPVPQSLEALFLDMTEFVNDVCYNNSLPASLAEAPTVSSAVDVSRSPLT